jgi:thioredoxin-related protein
MYPARYSLLFFLSYWTAALQAQVQFTDAPFEHLLQKADSSKRYVMVDAYTDWCGWCKTMDRETFADSTIGAYINARFVGSKVNMEEDFGIDLAMKHRVSQYPQYLFFDTDGHLLARISGYLKPSAFIEAVEDALFAKAHLPKGEAPLNFTLDYPDWHRNSFLKNKDRSYPDAMQVEAWLSTREDLSDEVSWGVLTRFVGGGTYALKIAEMRELLIDKYGKEEVHSKLAALIFNDVKEAIKNADEQILNHALQACDDYLGDNAQQYKLRYRLYYHQMSGEWLRYTQVVNTMRKDPEHYDEASILFAAQTIQNLCQDDAAIAEALKWLAPLTTEEAAYPALVLYAGLLQKSGDTLQARTYAKRALTKAAAEGGEGIEAQKILDEISE